MKIDFSKVEAWNGFTPGHWVDNIDVRDFIQKNYTPYVFHASRDVKFTLATLGNDAGIYGAAKLVLD